MAFSTRFLFFASLACTSFGALFGNVDAGVPAISPTQAVEFGVTALNFTADILMKAHATPSGRSPHSDAAFLRKLSAELSGQQAAKGHGAARIAESALTLGTDALKLGAEVMANTSPFRSTFGRGKDAPSHTVSRRSSGHVTPRMFHASGHREVPSLKADVDAASLYKRGRQGAVPSSARRGHIKSSKPAAAVNREAFNDFVAGTSRRDVGTGPLSLGHVGSQAALRSMDDLPMGGGFLSGIGGSSPFGGSANSASSRQVPLEAPALPEVDKRPHFHAVTATERQKASESVRGGVV